MTDNEKVKILLDVFFAQKKYQIMQRKNLMRKIIQ